MGISKDDAPSGLVIAAINTLNGYADIALLDMESSLQNVDAYEQILETLANKLQEKGLRFLTMLCPPNSPLGEAMDRRGWGRPHLWALYLEFDCYAFHPSWFEKHTPVSDPFSLFPLCAANPEQEEQIEKHVTQYGVFSYLSPFQYKEYLQPVNSLGLSLADEVVGWMATHTFPDKPTFIHYSSLYIKPELRSYGYAISLLIASIRKQQASPLQWASIELSLRDSNRSWLKFVKKRLTPYSAKKVERFRRELYLS